MNGAFERFISAIIRQTDSSEEERQDLNEELLSHLYCSFDDLRSQGYSEEEAVMMAMSNFGEEKEIGGQLQQAMYPYRREMMLVLAGSSLLFTFSAYLLQLFTRGDAHIYWLILAVLISSSILTVTLHPLKSFNRRFTMNGLLIGHIFTFVYGSLVAADLDGGPSIILTIFAYAIVLLSIILVYRTTIFDYPSSRQPFQRDTKIIHFINITVGILLTAITLFFLWAFMAFAEEMNAAMLLIAVPVILWIISYVIQIYLLKARHKAWAYSIAVIQTLVIAAVFIVWQIGI